MELDSPHTAGNPQQESLRAIQETLRDHLAPDQCDDSAALWSATVHDYPTRDALFNSIVEFTREVARSHNLDTVAKQRIRSALFQRLLR